MEWLIPNTSNWEYGIRQTRIKIEATTTIVTITIIDAIMVNALFKIETLNFNKFTEGDLRFSS